MEAVPNKWSVFNCVVLGLSVQIIKCFALRLEVGSLEI